MIRVASVATVAIFAASITYGASAQEAICPAPGTVSFLDVPSAREELIPSLHRELSGYGRFAYQNGCDIVITCVLDPADGEEAADRRNDRCGTIRQALARFLSFGKTRDQVASSYQRVNKDATGQWQAGAVYVTLK